MGRTSKSEELDLKTPLENRFKNGAYGRKAEVEGPTQPTRVGWPPPGFRQPD